ncbi:hypothetical protein BR93DRAFT_918402 [Coniochaeta sp. PMI_546]|nr:hypothetical protein BR93DRAFT_918402 [Coniochaeta sp. PMI_546]
MTPEDVELLFQSRDQHQGSVSVRHEGDDTISDEETSFRVLQLKGVLPAVHNAWISGSEELDYIAEKLADGSRDASWRVPLGDSGLLNFFLSILHVEGLRQHLLIHALRLIGNSCADTDENRARVVQSKQMTSIVKLSSDDSLLPFVIPVVYNVCVDYEPAQLEACNAGLSRVLVEILASKEPEANMANPATATCLLNLAVSRTYPPDLEDFCGLTSVALAYLTHERFQAHLLESGSCELLMQCFEDSYGRFDITNTDPEETAELKQLWIAFVQIFADISASPYFAALPLASPPVQRLVQWLGSPFFSYPHLQTAACLSLGNIARSDETSTALLRDVYGPISTMLTSMSPPAAQLLHAVLSFLKNLAIPVPNKPILGQLLLEPPSNSILSRLWLTETQQQTQFAAISLTRLLVSSCPANVSRLCTPLSPDPSSPAHERTNLHLLISVGSRADAEPTKFEVARTVAAVCKVLHTPYPPTSQPLLSWGSDPPDNSSRERFYSAHEAEISKCLADLLTQHRFPALRSECLFAMALMSRSADGAKVVCRALHPVVVSGALVEAVTGRNMADGVRSSEGSEDSSIRQTGGGELDAIQGLGLEPQQVSLDPAQAASMSKIDRENGLVLVAELLRQDASVLPQFRRSWFEDMLKTGGEMVLNERRQEGE